MTGAREQIKHILANFKNYQFFIGKNRNPLGDVEYGSCRECSRPIERGKGAFMVTREFCSNACKQRDHRRRVERAKEMRAKKLSVPIIAKKLDTTPEVITKWLTKKK